MAKRTKQFFSCNLNKLSQLPIPTHEDYRLKEIEKAARETRAGCCSLHLIDYDKASRLSLFSKVLTLRLSPFQAVILYQALTEWIKPMLAEDLKEQFWEVSPLARRFLVGGEPEKVAMLKIIEVLEQYCEEE
jgi:hypothetical protein